MVRRLVLVLLCAAVTAVSLACDDGGGGPAAPTRQPGSTATFTSGVAAGDVRVTGAVLWTRAEGGDRVVAEVATDEAFTQDVRNVAAETSADVDYTVHVKVTNLKPGTRHYYRFRAGDAVSPAGSFSTAPPFADDVDVRFVYAGDSDGRRDAAGNPVFGAFDVLRAAAREDPAFFIYLGDTIYADRDPAAAARAEYQAKYRLNREYGALTDLLARTQAHVMWDDHEVVNDFAGATVDPARLRAARFAFGDYWPLEADDDGRLYRSYRWGAHAELFFLDERSYRSAPATGACTAGGTPDPLPAFAAAGAPPQARAARQLSGLPAAAPAGCLEALADPQRTLLGAEQKAWLKRALTESAATWKIIVNPVPVQALALQPYDRWEGYAAERRELLEFIRDNGVKNVVFLTTDFHANIFGPVRLDPFDPASAVAYEAVTGPIATDTFLDEVRGAAGEGAAGVVAPFLTGVIGVDCAELDTFAYGLVEVARTGTLVVTAKDAGGRELCRKELAAAP
jgi:alkaline phosphatase D